MAHRKLTEGEIALAETVFKGKIDYSRVRLYDRPVYPFGLQAKGRAVARLNDISFPHHSYRNDFSKAADPHAKSVFIHELVHVWQIQNKIYNPVKEYIKGMAKGLLKGHFTDAVFYPYKLEPGRDLMDYGFEQQAAMIQDYYALRDLGLRHSYKNRRLNKEKDPEKLKKLYERVLGDFLKPGAPPPSPPPPVSPPPSHSPRP